MTALRLDRLARLSSTWLSPPLHPSSRRRRIAVAGAVLGLAVLGLACLLT